MRAAAEAAVPSEGAQPIQCSFCGKDRSACKSLISGPGNIYICDECVELCHDICGEPEDEALTQAELLALRARVAELEVERDRMLPIYRDHFAQQQRAAEHLERERDRVAALTEHELHREQRHPDYEYATTENARKSGEAPLPEGEGWEANDIIDCNVYKDGVVIEERWRNWTRSDYTETNYWRRRKPAEKVAASTRGETS
jgi:hypothetical protein